jgi:fumarylacetoacetase
MDAPHDPHRRSFLDTPAESDFPIQNLPYGVFRPAPGAAPRVGVAIGDWILDLAELEARGLFAGPVLRGRSVFQVPGLNAFMALGAAAWRFAGQRHDQWVAAG